VPPGSGQRAGIDRDEDGYLDRDEIDADSDPADPASTPVARTLIGSSKLILKDDADPTRRRLTFVSSTKNAPLPQRVVAPLPGSPGDPVIGGATLQVYNAAGMTTDSASVNLPAANWRALGTSLSPRGWRYRDSTGGAVRSLLVQKDRITIRGGRNTWTYTLDEAEQGQVAVRLQLGSGPGWCTQATPNVRGNPPSTASSDRPGLFKSTDDSAAPAACAQLP
jgi:hypothetical protein